MLVTAQRVQLRRTKGWRKPPGAVVVARPSRWGNPFRIVGTDRVVDAYDTQHTCAPGESRELAVRMYRVALLAGRLNCTEDDVRGELAGRDLACWCPLTEPCHADVLLEIANSGAQGMRTRRRRPSS